MTLTGRPAAMSFAAAGDAEELARAETYGVLAQLFAGSPDAALLAQFAHAVTEAPQPGAYLQEPWTALVGVLRASDVNSHPSKRALNPIHGFSSCH